MEPRFIYAILSTISTWLFSFFQKISVEQNHNPALVTFYSLTLAAIFWLIYLPISGTPLWNIWLWLLLWIVNWFLYFITTITRIKSLNYIDTSIYFPIYKWLAPIFIVLIWLYYFWEILTTKEFIWVALWILVPVILIWRNKKSNNTSKWIKFLFIWLLASTIAAATIKLWTNGWVNIIVYMTVSLITGSIAAFVLHKKRNKKTSYSIIKIKRIWILTGVFQFLWFYFLLKAIEIWNNLWVSFTMQSLYIIIPIILSIIFYREHFDKKKFIAIILTLSSIFFLG